MHTWKIMVFQSSSTCTTRAKISHPDSPLLASLAGHASSMVLVGEADSSPFLLLRHHHKQRLHAALCSWSVDVVVKCKFGLSSAWEYKHTHGTRERRHSRCRPCRRNWSSSSTRTSCPSSGAASPPRRPCSGSSSVCCSSTAGQQVTRSSQPLSSQCVPGLHKKSVNDTKCSLWLLCHVAVLQPAMDCE